MKNNNDISTRNQRNGNGSIVTAALAACGVNVIWRQRHGGISGNKYHGSSYRVRLAALAWRAVASIIASNISHHGVNGISVISM